MGNTLIALTVAFFVTSAITTFDVRLIQAIRRGEIPADTPVLPRWVGVVYYIYWGIGLTLLILNWKYALLIYVVKFILSFLGVLEMAGNVITVPVLILSQRKQRGNQRSSGESESV